MTPEVAQTLIRLARQNNQAPRDPWPSHCAVVWAHQVQRAGLDFEQVAEWVLDNGGDVRAEVSSTPNPRALPPQSSPILDYADLRPKEYLIIPAQALSNAPDVASD